MKRSAALVGSVLIDEITLSPKPDLVDMCGNSVHHDLGWTLMVYSARTLRPAFEAMTLAGTQIEMQTGAQLALREYISRLGHEGEVAVLEAIDGVNTYRGATWVLDLLVMAAAQTPPVVDAAAVACRVVRLTSIPDRFAPVPTGHKGGHACDDYGVSGVKGQACAGFPHMIKVALPALCEMCTTGIREDHAHVDALPAVMTAPDDTCILACGGVRALYAMQTGMATVRTEGGLTTVQGHCAFRTLE